LSRTDNDAAVEYFNDNIPCFALAETANGFLTGRYTGTDMPAPVEYDDIVEAQQTDAFCVELAKRVSRKTAKALFHNESHGLYRHAPYGVDLVILESLRERILELEHHAAVSAHPGMNRMYYAMRRRYYWPSMVTPSTTVLPSLPPAPRFGCHYDDTRLPRLCSQLRNH